MNGGGIIILIKKSSLMKERMVMYEKIWRVIDGSFIGRRGDSVCFRGRAGNGMSHIRLNLMTQH